METFTWFISEITSQFAYAAGHIFWNLLLFGFLGLAGGVSLVIIGRKRGWFRRESRVWSLFAKLNYLYLPLLLMVFGCVAGSFYGIKKTADHFVEKTASPLAKYAQEYASNIQAYLPEPQWAKEEDMTLGDMIAQGMAERGGLEPGSTAAMAAVAINYAIVEHVLDELGVPELVRDPVGVLRVLREASFSASMFNNLTPRLQSVCGHFIWLKYKVVLFFFLPFFLLPVGEYLVHRIFNAGWRRFSSESNKVVNMNQVFFFLYTAFLLSACNKDDNNITPNLPDSAYMNAKIDGKWVKTENPHAGIARHWNPPAPGDSIYNLAILGIETVPMSSALSLGLTTSDIPMTKKYETDGNAGDANPLLTYVIDTNNPSKSFLSAGMGNLTLKFDILDFKIGGRIKGTFSGILVEISTGKSVVVTDGEFDTYIE